MRIDRLDITAFGRLRDTTVEVQPALTVILGPNEAGKTTILRAVRAALYGLDAGGQGRPRARSDWAKWRPWERAERFGLSMTYTLRDGTRIRVARRLEEQREEAQVIEVGGRDMTENLRVGRLVVPGWHHLGIDEAVFCATACLGEESLRTDAPDAAAARADRLQEAIERLADSASRATAAEALARLRHAMDRVGTEGRSRSPLGLASARLRQLEEELSGARQRQAAVGGEQDRLCRLDEVAADADRRRVGAERRWLEARLAALAATRDELATARGEEGRLATCIADWAPFAAFPAELEDRLLAVAAELRQADGGLREAAQRWEDGRARMRAVERRRAELATSLHALGTAPHVRPAEREVLAALAEEVAGERGVERQAAEARTADARLTALRREVASTGLGTVPVGSAQAVGELVAEALEGASGRRLRPVAAAIAALGVVAAAACAMAGLPPLAAGLLAAVAGLAACATLFAERMTEGPGQTARRRLSRTCPGMDVSDAGLRRCAERLPALTRLHEDLRRQDLLVETAKAQLGAATGRIAELAQRCLVLAARVPVEVDLGPAAGLVGPDAELTKARQALAAVTTAAGAGARRAELEAEDGGLAREWAALRALHEAAEAASARREELVIELREHLATAGLELSGDHTAAIAEFRRGAATRRQLEDARTRLAEVRRHVAALGPGDPAALAAESQRLTAELVRRGGDPDVLAAELQLEPGRLHELEVVADTARNEAAQAGAEAADVRARIAGMLDGLPSIADLEDERDACVAVRTRAQRQLEALRHAHDRIEESARRVHRNVAPRLASSVGARLALLTEGRYSEVNVDADRFAVSLRTPDRPDLVPLDLLSHGTRDQVSLLLRIALAEALSDAGEPVPILLDDPLLSADPGRRESAVDFLLNLAARGHQILLTTAEPSVAEHVAAAREQGCGVVTLGGWRPAMAGTLMGRAV